MNVLLLGSGGREHAFAWKLSQSKLLTKLFIAPGNSGTSAFGVNVALNPLDFKLIKTFVINNGIELVVVGPEDPLVAGIVDFFKKDSEISGIPVIGPTRDGARLEGSKDFAKQFMIRHHIPTAAYQTFDSENLEEGYLFLESLKPPYVLKADGLAAGKGVVIIDNLDEAKTELKQMIAESKFGSASRQVVIEEFLSGIELSVFVLTDGNHYKILPPAKDYKRIGEGDTGPNTGGMGAVSPVPFANNDFMRKVEELIVKPTVDGLKADGITYRGFIFIGLMNVNGNPFVIEYNCRMGDPETEVVLPRIESDLLQLLLATAKETLDREECFISKNTAVTIMMVSKGYPGSYEKGKLISGLESVSDSLVFHAGTKDESQGIVTNGGRVLAITSMAPEMKEALAMSYANASRISFENKYYRSDIGKDLEKYF